MSEPNSSELRDLILGLDRKMDALDKKMDVRFAEQAGEIKRVEEKINGIDKRLGNEEFISRSAFTAVIVGVMAGLVKYLFFPSTF